MSTLKEVKLLAEATGAIVTDTKYFNVHECRVCAPTGKRWAASDVHEFVDCAYRPWKPDYQDLLDRMAGGVEDCPDPDCDWCADMRAEANN